MSTQRRLNEAVGRVVYAAQLFEFVFTLTVRLALRQPNVTSLEEIDPLSMRTSFKAAVKNVLKDPAVLAVLSEQQVARIDEWVERRHRIVHRRLTEEGWPENHEADKITALIADCRVTESDALAISAELCDLLIPWFERIPELRIDGGLTSLVINLRDRLAIDARRHTGKIGQ